MEQSKTLTQTSTLTDTLELLPIRLNAMKGNWLSFQSRKRNPKFQLIKSTVLQRDHYTCRYCGFFSKEFHDVVNIDHNYKNNHLSNLATACCFCSQCFFIDSIGLADGTGGTIIYLPEISQYSLNNICRVLFCSSDKDSAYRGKLKSVIMSFRDRSNEVLNCFGPHSDQPKVFGQAWIDAQLPNITQVQNHEILRHLKLMPAKEAFSKQIEYWKKTVFAKVPL
ncbi:MAG: type IVB secretion system protein IcmJDotN [Candidatus Berkiella sp.]